MIIIIEIHVSFFANSLHVCSFYILQRQSSLYVDNSSMGQHQGETFLIPFLPTG